MRRVINSLILPCVLFVFVAHIVGQEKPPVPSAPKSAKVPPVVEKTLPNSLSVATVEKHSTPIVTIEMVVFAGASRESEDKADLANITASMLTKGTTTRTATQ